MHHLLSLAFADSKLPGLGRFHLDLLGSFLSHLLCHLLLCWFAFAFVFMNHLVGLAFLPSASDDVTTMSST